jgi:hypothetical protein
MKTNETRITKLAATRPFQRVSDRRVRRELRRATFHAALAARRARNIGAARATGDRRVTRGFQRSSLHAVRALSFSINPPPSHRVRNTVLIVTGAATTVVAVVAIRTKPWRSSDEAAPAVEDMAAATEPAREETAAETEDSGTEDSRTETTPSSTVEASTESVQ